MGRLFLNHVDIIHHERTTEQVHIVRTVLHQWHTPFTLKLDLPYVEVGVVLEHGGLLGVAEFVLHHLIVAHVIQR